jgi:glucose 1-dehydrogenase
MARSARLQAASMRIFNPGGMSAEQRVALVTGAATGIGKAIALKLAHESVAILVDYADDAASAENLVAAIEAAGGKAAALHADISKTDDVERLIGLAVERYGGLDILVNNAGIEEKHAFVDTPLEVVRRILEVNFFGTWLCSQAAARLMIRQNRGGRIVNISSVHEELPMPTNAPYCASKGAVRMLMRTIADELAAYGITVNNVCPGAVDTPMDQDVKANPNEYRTLLREIPLRRMARPEEIADLVAYLAGDSAAYVTGASFVIDGGMTVRSGSL